MAITTAAAMAVGAAVNVIGGLFGASAASKRRAKAMKKYKSKMREITRFENQRQAITNPYATFTSLASKAVDLSSEMTNPYANLGVAAKSAEIKMEQTDIALSNTLDTLRATGSSAGGATALAQAALQSKNDVASSLEKQEAENEKLRAQGESRLEEMKISEKRRIQGIDIAEGQRMQDSEAKGKMFIYQAKDARENQKLNRMADEAAMYAKQAGQAANAGASAISSGISGISSMIGAGISSGALK